MIDVTRIIHLTFDSDPALMAEALRRVSMALDASDEGRSPSMDPELSDSDGGQDDLAAWATVAVMLAAQSEIPTSDIMWLADALWKGSQLELPGYERPSKPGKQSGTPRIGDTT